MGPSGSGKTTLLNCLSGLDAIDGGDVLIEGVSLARCPTTSAPTIAPARMGFVFQFYNLMPVLTRRRERRAAAAGSRVPPARRASGRSQALEMVGLADRAAHVPEELSGGQRQRFTIARALVNDPAIVWADEPTGDLDSENAQEIVQLMRRLNRERGLTFLIVTHDIAVGRSTDRIVRMVDGRDRRRRASGGGRMVARVTLAEIDAVRMSVESARWTSSASRWSRRCASRRATRACTCCSRTPEARCSR